MMKIDALTKLFQVEKNCWILAAIFLALAFLIATWNQGMESKMESLKREYQLDQILSKNRSDYEMRYQRILAEGSAVESHPMNQNEWVRQTQSQIRERQLSLRELTPLTGDSTKLMLALEGEIAPFLQYLIDLARSNHSVFIEKFNVAKTSDDGKRIRAELILAQG